MSIRKPLTIEEIHQGTLDVLKVIIQICDELNINYYLAYGTLLGAIRHKGFIPWDDDLDIMMVRRDYDLFLDYCEKNKENLRPYCLLHYTNTKNYPYTIPRFCDSRCRMENENPVLDVEGMGFFVDVYPLDGLPNESEKLKAAVARTKKTLLTGFSFATTKQKPITKRNAVSTVARAVFRLGSIVLGQKFFTDWIEKFAAKYPYDECDYITCLTWEEEVFLYRKEYFENYELVDFEDIKAKVPVGYDAILREAYGDYMTPPPEDKRIGHHFYKLYRIEED